MIGRVVDERTDPALRQVIGRLLVDARHADVALSRIRLAALDLSPEEIAGVARCRVLLGHLDARTLLDMSTDFAAAGRRLLDWLDSGRIEVRSAGVGSWTPDFSVYTSRSGGTTCLLGAHYFGAPHLTVGPSVTVIVEDGDAGTLLRGRFQELWDAGHDVKPAIQAVLRQATAPADRTRSTGAAG